MKRVIRIEVCRVLGPRWSHSLAKPHLFLFLLRLDDTLPVLPLVGMGESGKVGLFLQDLCLSWPIMLWVPSPKVYASPSGAWAQLVSAVPSEWATQGYTGTRVGPGPLLGCSLIFSVHMGWIRALTLANKVDPRNGLVLGVQPSGWMAPTGWCDFFFFMDLPGWCQQADFEVTFMLKTDWHCKDKSLHTFD